MKAGGTELYPPLFYELSAASLPPIDRLCMPVLGQGRLLGILQLHRESPGNIEGLPAGLDTGLPMSAAETLGLALANLLYRTKSGDRDQVNIAGAG